MSLPRLLPGGSRRRDDIPTTSRSAVYRFNDFLLDPENRSLTRAGRALKCGSKTFDLLVLLVANAGELVTREAIRSRLWAERVVEFDQAINNYIRDLRRVLGDETSRPRYVKTAPKHGYVFVAPVTRERRWVRRRRSPVGWGIAVILAATVLVSVMVRAPEPRGSRLQDVTRAPAPAALAAYIKGRSLYDTHQREGRRESIRWFREAVTLDENYALAWSGLADALYYASGATGSDIEAARQAVDRSLALDPDLVAALHRRADILFAHDWEFEQAAEIFAQAIAMDGGNVSLRHSYSAFQLATGDTDGAISELDLALSINPLSAVMTSDLAWTLSLAGRHNAALQKCKILLDLAPGDMRAIACPLRPLLALGRISEAAEVANTLLAGAGVQVQSTDSTQILRAYWLRQAQSRGNAFAVAIARARLGQPLRALEALEQARAQRSRMMPFVHLYPEFEAMHQVPRFQAVSVISAQASPSQDR